jgi:DNA-binding MarR family transcriptional regulator
MMGSVRQDLPQETLGEKEALESLPHQVLRRFRLIFKAVQQHSQWVETCCGVSSAQLWVLWEINGKPGIRVTELAEAMSIHQSTASNLLLKLTQKALVTRERDQQDQRVVSLYLTELGKETLAKAPSPAQGILKHALFQLPDPTLDAMRISLEALIHEMNIMQLLRDKESTSALVKASRKSKKNSRNIDNNSQVY